MPMTLLSNGSTIGYLINGELDLTKSTILVLHAFLSDKHAWTDFFQSPLAQLVNLVAVDLHGHGETSGRKEWTYWDNAEDIIGLMVSSRVLNAFAHVRIICPSVKLP